MEPDRFHNRRDRIAVNELAKMTSARPTFTMSRFMTLLGTGAGDGGTHRNKSSIAIQCTSGAVLLDAGEPCAQTLQALGLGREYLQAVFISHTHADHVAGLPALLQDKQVGLRRNALPIYLPPHLVEPLNGWLNALAMPREALSYSLLTHPLAAGQTVCVDDLTITSFPTTHDCEGDRASFGFVVRRGTQSVIYSSDLGQAGDLLPVVSQPATYLICELSHVTPEDLIRVLQSARLDALLITHVGLQYLDHLSEIRDFFDKSLPQVENVFTPMDGESFPF